MTYPNWFTCYADLYFEKHLRPLAGQPGLRFLQVGAFTGDASLWLLENVLTGAGSVLVDVDTWRGSNEPLHDGFDWADVERTYDERTAKYQASGALLKFQMPSRRFLARNQWEQFDFIYIDGDHTRSAVLTDGLFAHRALKPGGLIAFDDYLWQSGKGKEFDPGPGIDDYAGLKANDIVPLAPIGPMSQAWFRKIR